LVLNQDVKVGAHLNLFEKSQAWMLQPSFPIHIL